MKDTAKPEIVGLLHRINEGATSSHTPLGEARVSPSSRQIRQISSLEQ